MKLPNVFLEDRIVGVQAGLEARLREVYGKAFKGLDAEAMKAFDHLRKEDAQMVALYKAGEIDLKHLTQWRLNNYGKGERFEKMRDDIADRMRKTNKVASAYINNSSAEIYSLTHNYRAYQIENLTGASFSLVNERTIRELMMGDNHVAFRTVNPNPVRDYLWNSAQVQKNLTASILQGKGMDGIAASFLQVMQRNKMAAVRNARTATTSARAAGEQAIAEEAAEQGIEIKKEWVAFNDDRTRDSHTELNGVQVDVDQPFPNGMMYPGDPTGDPSEVYNCRCRIVEVLPFLHPDSRTGKTVESYNEWLKGKEKQQEQQTEQNAEQNLEMISVNTEEKTPEQIRIENIETVKHSLDESYEYHRVEHDLNLVPLDELKLDVTHIDFKNMDDRGVEIFTDQITELSNMYDTTLQTIRPMTQEEYLRYGLSRSYASVYHDYYMDNSTMLLNPLKMNDTDNLIQSIRTNSDNRALVYIVEGNEGKYVPTHEFAHTMISMEGQSYPRKNHVGADYGELRTFRKEINSVYNDYMKEVEKLQGEFDRCAELLFSENATAEMEKAFEAAEAALKDVFLSDYSLTNVDEFYAEAFTSSHIGENTKYARIVRSLTDRYFGR